MLRSSVWLETPETRCVWLTLLLLKDKNGFVSGGSVAGLAHIARVSESDCEKAMKIFMTEDKKSSNPDNRGKRIEKVENGWRVLNHENYQFSTEAKRLAWAEHKRMQREREREKAALKKLKRSRPQAGETKAVNGTPVQDLEGELKDVRQAKGGFDPLA